MVMEVESPRRDRSHQGITGIIDEATSSGNQAASGGGTVEAASSSDRWSRRQAANLVGPSYADVYRFFMIFRTFLGDFTPGELDSRSL